MIPIHTNRLKLRGLESSDDKNIFLLRSDQQVNAYLDRKLAASLKDAQNFIHNIQSNQKENQLYYWGIILSENQTLVGTICLFDVSKDLQSSEIGFELLPGFQGKGLMLEAVEAVVRFACESLEMHTIKAVTHKDNIGSIKLLEKLHFQKNENAVSENDLISFYRNM